MRASFEPLVQFHRRLEQQEQAADQQDQVAAGERVVEYGEQRRGEPHDPGQRGQQAQSHQQRQAQADEAGLVTLVGRKLVRKDRDEDEVVDAEDYFENDKCGKTHPDCWVG
ncbi:hypothetical protein D3C71_1792290 [compost metagenome]